MATVSERTRHQGETLGWAALGLGAGFLAGFLLGEVFGGVTRSRVAGAVRGVGNLARSPSPVDAAARVREALASDNELAPHGIEVLRVGRTAAELHGWVPVRQLRARAFRIATDAAGGLAVTNCLLVHGEDDLAGPQEQASVDTTRTA